MNVGFNYAGGTFSHIQILLEHIVKYRLTRVYADNRIGNGSFKDGLNFFDILFDQTPCAGKYSLTNSHTNFQDIWSHEKFNELKKATSVLKIKKDFDFKMEPNVLGVHVRLTSFNSLHGKDYNHKTYDDYVKLIDKTIIDKEIKTIFVASDNEESLQKLENRYENIHVMSLKTAFRYQKENEDSLANEFDNINDERFFVDSFNDMLMLSKCCYNIGRPSALNNCALLFSNTIKERFIV